MPHAHDIFGPEHLYFDMFAAIAGLFMGLLGYRCYRPCLFISGCVLRIHLTHPQPALRYLVGGAIAYHTFSREDEVLCQLLYESSHIALRCSMSMQPSPSLLEQWEVSSPRTTTASGCAHSVLSILHHAFTASPLLA